MAIAPPASLNGRPRKQLCDQLDRLDEVINGMEEYLPQAVADAARDGIRQAFRDVLGELVTDPAVLNKLRTVILPDAAPLNPKPSAFARLKVALSAAASQVKATLKSGLNRVTSAPRSLTGTVKQSLHAAKTRIAFGLLFGVPFKSIITVGLVTGVIVATVSYIAPHHIAALISGISTSLTAMGLQVARWFRTRHLSLVN
ncbi:hypothetical protein BH11PLA2_BH11PLA2_29770 [soil metagenome]